MNVVIKPKYKDDTVLDILRREEKIYLLADCGGTGSCGKCRIKFFDPGKCPKPSEKDRMHLTESELKDGFRLACTTLIEEETEIMIPETSMVPETGPEEGEVLPPAASEIIAVDLGTTMISGALVDLNKGVIKEAGTVNHQKAYGADVISRIEAAGRGYGEELRHIALDDLADLSVKLGRDPDKARYIISANTVMGHLASGFSCKGLGEYPYKPVDISLRRDGNMTFLPGISGYVGADIVSGICILIKSRGYMWI